MGYPSISKFDEVFIQRTKDNLSCKVTNTYTHLVNCLLGLIILPKQWIEQEKRKSDFFNKKIVDLPELSFLQHKENISDEFSASIEISKLDFRHQPLERLTIGIMIDRLRHSIAHQSIRATKENQEWKGILFRNYSTEKRTSEWKDNYDFQLYLNMTELKKFSLFIADNYLKDIQKKK